MKPICLKSKSVDVVGSQLRITVPKTSVEIKNKEKFNLVICQNIPSAGALLPIFIVIEGVATTFPLLTKIGNYTRGDQVKTRKCYNLIAGTDFPHFLIDGCVCETAFTDRNVIKL